MTSSRDTSSVVQCCLEAAHDGIFWRSGTHAMNEVQTVNVLMALNGTEESWDCKKCFGKIVEPALPELRHTPTQTQHEITAQDAKVFFSSRFNHLDDIITRAIENHHLVCFIAVGVKWVDGDMQIIFSDKCSGISVWNPGFDTKQVRVAEMFCGGFAGWAHALKHLREMGMDVATSIAVDTAVDATHMYAANHEGKIIGCLDDPRESRYTLGHGVCVIPFPVELPTWYHLLYETNTQVWCMSPPCPAFSKATDMLGFLRKDGQTTLEAICTVRLNQPALVCLENVPGMADPENLKTMKGMFRWAGYRLCHHEINDLADVAPSSRKRWLSIWVRHDLVGNLKPGQMSWFKARDFNINDFGICELNIPDDIIGDFTLTNELMELYGDAALLPATMSKGRSITDVIQGCMARCVTGSSRYSTFVAKYGSQHDLTTESLSTKGMFAQLVACGNNLFRFITPFEQLLVFATRLPVLLPLNLTDTFRSMGNAISPQQALYCLTKAFQMAEVEHVPSLDAMLVVLQFVSKRPKGVDVEIRKLDDWYVMYVGNFPEDLPIHDLALLPYDETLQDHALTTVQDAESTHIQTKRDKGSDDPMYEEPPTKVPKVEEPQVSPTEPFDVETNCPGPVEDPDPDTVLYANVTVVLPMDAIVGRYRVPTTPREILQQHGYDPSFMMLRHVQGTADMMDSIITADCAMVVFTSCQEHVEQAARSFRSIFARHFAHSEREPKMTLTIKHGNTIFWEGLVGMNTQLECIHEAVFAELRRAGLSQPLRWTSRGRALNHTWGWKMCDISKSGLVKLHFHFPIQGGAPRRDSKIDESMKTQLTSSLVACGVGFSQLLPSITLIANECSATQIQHAIQAKEGEQRQKLVQQLLQDAGYFSPKEKLAKRSRAATQIQKAVRAKRFGAHHEIDIASLTIDATMFINEDKTQAKVKTGPFEPNSTGVFLTNVENAKAWIQSPNTISADELAVLLVGHVDVPTGLKFKHVQFRAHQPNGNTLLLRGTLYQLGAKEISVDEGTVTKIQCPSTSVATFTAYSDEFPDMAWKDLVNSPGKVMLDLFDETTRKQSILNIWGHSFQKAGKPCRPHEADSVQIHARVLSSALNQLLGQSGWNCIYMVPKNDNKDNRTVPDAQYAVVWTGCTKQETMLQAKGIQATLGLVRNRNSVGIRVAHDTFLDSWRKIHPDRAAPSTIQVQKVYRAQNLPCNITVVELRKWLETIKWSAKPLKKVAYNACFIGAEAEPSSKTYVVNDNVILLTLQIRKQEAETPVLAGKPQFIPKRTNQETAGDLDEDPWAAWKENHPGKSVFAPVAAPTNVQRQIDGPVNQRFAEQDAKIDTLSRKFDELHALQGKIHEENTSLLQQQNNKFTELTRSVDARLTQQTEENNAKFNTLHGAVESGRKAQEEQFNILRDMLMQSVATGSRKSQKTDGKSTPGGEGD
eukprot:Skav203292  [mRNA]  locus=scaffold5484:132792:137099:+ [translate_table: standard]